MHVRFLKNLPAAQADTLTCVRPDGSATTAEVRRLGVLPREAVHFVVESTLGWHDAFYGQIAQGAALHEINRRVHHAPRAWTKDTQVRQSAAIVDCLQAEQWGGAADPVAFAQALLKACRQRGVQPPEVTAEEIDHLRTALREFGAAWRPLGPGAALERTF